MTNGYFDDAKREYVITDPRTPVPWINYIGSLDFGGFVDQKGGGVICKGDPAINRITKYIPQLPGSDMNAETLYVRVKEGSGYNLFSAFYTPTMDSYDLYECHVGLGYSTIITEIHNIRTETTIFVPADSERVIRKIVITNKSDQAKEIDLIPVIEYTHFEAIKQFNNADWVPQTMQSRVLHKEDGILVLGQYAFMNKDIAMNYFTSNSAISSFESDRAKFLGQNGYGSWRNPDALQSEELSNTEANRGDNIGALLHKLGEIKPGESKTIITQLGQCADIEKEMPEIRKYRDVANVDKALDELASYWSGLLDTMQVETPSKDLDRMVNVHNARQCYMTKNWSRYLSLYQLGLGARGIGMRDSSQDVTGFIPFDPADCKRFLKVLLSMQCRDGFAMHQFNPLSLVATIGDAHEKEDRPDYYGDDHLWIILAVTEYIRETGDTAFLEDTIPFYDKDKHNEPIEKASVLDHMLRGIEFTRTNVGAHGIPLLGFADWNDTVNLPTGAESLFVTSLYGRALSDLIGTAAYIKDSELEVKLRGYHEAMNKQVNEVAWDGEWYVRYFDHEGQPMGSTKNEKGKIYTNGQSWPVLAGFATGERALSALDSVNKHLNTKNGIKLSAPGFDHYDPVIGGITTYPPGAKENGGIFLHSNPWVIIAETIVGNGDRAFQYYEQINPASKNDKIEEYEVEPYCYAQNILADEHPQFGLGRNSWLSGTASWMYQAATKHMLGIRPDYAGLLVDPCIPASWDGFSAKRRFRGALYNIEVKNPNKVSKGVASVTVNGEKIDGNIISYDPAIKEYTVEVVMG